MGHELDGLGQGDYLQFSDDKGRRTFIAGSIQVPLNGSRDADQVNVFEYWLYANQRSPIHNSWVTDIK
jgi:hypothetical protein